MLLELLVVEERYDAVMEVLRDDQVSEVARLQAAGGMLRFTAEQVVRVVLLLDVGEAVKIGAVRCPDALLVLVSGLEVDAVPVNRRSSLSSARYSVFQQ